MSSSELWHLGVLPPRIFSTLPGTVRRPRVRGLHRANQGQGPVVSESPGEAVGESRVRPLPS